MWEAIDGELSLAATTTPMGNVTLIVKMSVNDGDYTATALLKLEAGSLQRIAEDVRASSYRDCLESGPIS